MSSSHPWYRRGRRVLFILMLCLALVVAGPTAFGSSKEEIPLQSLIDSTADGGTLFLEGNRVYTGPAVIAKPITIVSVGSEALIVNQSDFPVLSLQANGIHLAGLRIRDEQTNPKKPAILVTSSGNRIERVHLVTQGGGIYLRQADDNAIVMNRIEGKHALDLKEAYSLRGNGIDLLASSRNRIEDNTIIHVHDGVYVESSNDTLVKNNRTEESRYGFHFMFSGNPQLRNNTGSRNVTGAMVMGVERATVKGNRFDKQTDNVNSQGILLFDVHRSEISNNRVEGNRVGFYIENSTENKLMHNEVMSNFIGMQMIHSDGNNMEDNSFVSNVIQAQSSESKNNKLVRNYWDDNEGLDVDGDTFSDMPYEIDPFFLKLTEDIEAYQIFFQSPGLPFLQTLFRADTSNWLKDMNPLLSPSFEDTQGESEKNRIKMLLLGFLLFSFATIIIYRWGYNTK